MERRPGRNIKKAPGQLPWGLTIWPAMTLKSESSANLLGDFCIRRTYRPKCRQQKRSETERPLCGGFRHHVIGQQTFRYTGGVS